MKSWFSAHTAPDHHHDATEFSGENGGAQWGRPEPEELMRETEKEILGEKKSFHVSSFQYKEWIFFLYPLSLYIALG